MKKFIISAFVAVISLGMFSCTKQADVAATEPNLPSIQISSLGTQQISPLTISSGTLTLMFGATTTNAAPAAFKLEFYAATSATGPITKTVNFPTWSGSDDAAGGHTISYVLEPTSYPNTQVYGGTINLKLSTLGLAAGKTYTVKAYAYKSGNATPSTITTTSLFKVQ
ncbi:hypothetical protein [Mucilaginibacter ginkgonis]|uniref:Uncharacterized protein n=1 Tax=Mucilaginibacter ginkgonis TaxID=2682091 RepID=A0A6I4HXB2_9SPHI|nr:hypothetical protein [Mucilaginibacter ginkgonis]QQL50980.1 hypothetical protein GO620_005885 [Mucilaginibacter ginkgonis]